jgi:hypothetical protein
MLHAKRQRLFINYLSPLARICVGLLLLTLISGNSINRAKGYGTTTIGEATNTNPVQNGDNFLWVNANPVGTSPAARSGHRMVYDSSRSRVVMFGGLDSQNNFRNDI